MSLAPIIETPRLILRPWRDEDVDPWVAMNLDLRVMEFFPKVYNRAQCESRAAALRAALDRDGYGEFIVEVKDSSAVAGTMVLMDAPLDAPFAPAKEIGWRFAFDSWGKGYATEAAIAALDFAFTTLGWDEIIAVTSVLNVRSQRVMERIGMTRDPSGDFDSDRIPDGHRLKRHVLYRIRSH